MQIDSKVGLFCEQTVETSEIIALNFFICLNEIFLCVLSECALVCEEENTEEVRPQGALTQRPNPK